MPSGDSETFVVGLGLIGALFILSILSFASPTAATIGLIFLSPFLLFYGMLHFSPKVKKLLQTPKPIEPPFDFPNHSAAYNVSNNTSNDEDDNEYNSDVRDESEFTNENVSRSRSPRDRNRRIQKAEAKLEIRHPYTEKDLDSAYREKVQIHHPDKKDGSEDEFKSIQDAYELLSDEQTYTESSASKID